MNNVIKISLPDPTENEAPEQNDGPLLLNSSPSTPVDNNTVVVNEPFIYKGASEVVLDFSGVSEQDNRVISIVIDWGDGSPREYYNKKIIFEYRENSIIEEVTRGFLGGSILGSFSHAFTPADTHINNITTQALLTYENGVDVIIKQPLTIIQESYYDNIKEFNIANIAVQDGTLSTMANLQSKHTNWTWPAYFTLEADIGDEAPQDNPFEAFDCNRTFESVDVIKDIITEGPYQPGMTVVYNVSVVNAQSFKSGCTLTDTLTGIRFNDPISADFETGNGILPLSSTTVISYSYDITNDDIGVIENIATISAPALRYPVNSNPISIDVRQNLSVVKGGPGSIIAAAGEFVTYTVTATNLNDAPATNVRLFDSLPGVENNIVTGDADLFTGTTIPAGGSKTVTYQYQLQSSDVSSGSLVNVARLSGDGYAFVEDSATTTLTPLQN